MRSIFSVCLSFDSSFGFTTTFESYQSGDDDGNNDDDDSLRGDSFPLTAHVCQSDSSEFFSFFVRQCCTHTQHKWQADEDDDEEEEAENLLE